MTTILKYAAKVFFFVLAVMLIAWSAGRGLDFIQSTLPEGQKANGYFGLAGTEIGMLVWLLVFMYAARSIGQYVTAGIMTLVDLAGAIALFTFDSLLRAGQSGMITTLQPEEVKTVILALNGLIGANVIATVLYHLADSETQKRISEAVMEGLLELKVMAAIERQGRAIVDAKAPELADQYLEEFKARFGNANALGLSANQEKQDDELPEWLDWREWLQGYQAARKADKAGPVIYQNTVTSPLAETKEGSK
ncbi:hypothetical protein [Candidatus Villigracilis saccharophilus]|uniref:hypothetical protein n=1 Tax=Candidatus Villigracilis saccharophilus TaxID=3140684 RepID=UPI0031372EA8|nr:hypothetical protein [Anaerolineales bacterium]